jgi:hypothetical protein
MEPDEERTKAGLCADCRFARRIDTGKGSRFFLCRRSEGDPAFDRYPRLPMRTCRGYEIDRDRRSGVC